MAINPSQSWVHSKKFHYWLSKDNDIQKKFKFKSRKAFMQAKLKYKALFLNRLFWIGIGKVLAVLYALGCALTIAAAAVAFLCGLTGIMWPGIIAGVIMAVSGFVFNIKISWKSTPQVLLDFFARGGWFKGLFEYIDRAGNKIKLSTKRRRWFYFGIIAAVAAAATWAAIGWGEILGAFSLLLSVSAAALPPGLIILTGIVLTGLFIATLAMLLKEMSHMLGKGDVVKQLSTFWAKVKNVFSGRYFKNIWANTKKTFADNPVNDRTHLLNKDAPLAQKLLYVFTGQYFKQCWAASKAAQPDKPKRTFIKQLLKDFRRIFMRDESASFAKQVFKDSMRIFVYLTVVGLTVAGLVMVMKTGAESLAELLVNQAKFSTIAANIVASVNCFLFAFAGELPFALGTSTVASASINKWFSSKKHAANDAAKKPKRGFKAKLTAFAKVAWRPIHFFNALGMGLIAMKTFMGNLASKCSAAMANGSGSGASPDIGMMTFSLLTGFFNSYAAGFHGDEEDDQKETQYRQLRRPQSNIRQRLFSSDPDTLLAPSASDDERLPLLGASLPTL